MERLLAAPVRRVSVRPLVAEGWQLRHNLTVADALYVVVAKHLNAPLVTTDNKLAAAPTLPVATITP
jgi:predicted nucleic acid-binding protein